MKKKPNIRFLYEMKPFLFDKLWLRRAKNFGVYFMYRGIRQKDQLRYDVTKIKPKMLGQEFPKTIGHDHSKNFQEVYEVLKGNAIFLFQKYKNNEIKYVYAVRAKAKEAVLVPPGYGHVTINPTQKELKIANWISEKCKNSYSLFKKFHGACYYYTKEGWVKNGSYELRSKKKIPNLHFKKPLKKLPKNLDFLKN